MCNEQNRVYLFKRKKEIELIFNLFCCDAIYIVIKRFKFQTSHTWMMEFVQLARVPSHSYETYTLAGFVHKLTEMMINVPGSMN